jgi:hypothetical protein
MDDSKVSNLVKLWLDGFEAAIHVLPGQTFILIYGGPHDAVELNTNITPKDVQLRQVRGYCWEGLLTVGN